MWTSSRALLSWPAAALLCWPLRCSALLAAALRTSTGRCSARRHSRWHAHCRSRCWPLSRAPPQPLVCALRPDQEPEQPGDEGPAKVVDELADLPGLHGDEALWP
uniref:Secreted protein n=1 Tax=Arundo donax TaxID=35708 RepID=A0A0A9FKR0_ARUDO